MAKKRIINIDIDKIEIDKKLTASNCRQLLCDPRIKTLNIGDYTLIFINHKMITTQVIGVTQSLFPDKIIQIYYLLGYDKQLYKKIVELEVAKNKNKFDIKSNDTLSASLNLQKANEELLLDISYYCKKQCISNQCKYCKLNKYRNNDSK